MGIKPTEGEVRAEFEAWCEENAKNLCLRDHSERPYHYATTLQAWYAWQASRANLLAEQDNAVPFGYIGDREKQPMADDGYAQVVRYRPSFLGVAVPVYLHPPKDTNPLNHTTQDLYEHFLAVHNLYHTDDLRKAFYHGAGEHTPEELAGFRAKGDEYPLGCAPCACASR